MITNDDLVTQPAPRSRLTLARERLVGLGVVGVSGVALLLAAQVHHWLAPHDSGGAAAELVPVLLGGALGWLVVFGAAILGPHRSGDPRSSSRYALGFGLFALPTVVLAYWTPIPWCLGVAGLLMVRRARSTAARTQMDVTATVLAWIAIGAPVAIFVAVIVAALN